MPSHYSTLPLEVLGEIFLRCLPERDSDRLDPNQAPMLLCRVSSFWRKAALAEHRLWDTIIFPPTSQARGSTRSCERFISSGGAHQWFSRSGSRLLSFGEEASVNPMNTLLKLFPPFLKKYGRRMRRLDLVIPSAADIQYLIKHATPMGPFPELVKLSISTSPLEWPDTPFMDAVKLTDVQLVLLGGSGEVPGPMLPNLGKQLRSVGVYFAGRFLTVDGWRELFGRSPELESAEILLPVYGHLPIAADIQEVRESRLKSLTLFDRDNEDEDQVRRIVPSDAGWRILNQPIVFTNLLHLELVMNRRRTSVGDQKTLVEVLKQLEKLESLTISPYYAGQALLDVPPAVHTLVTDIIFKSMSFGSLKELRIPYRDCHSSDIQSLLRSRPPTHGHPGLRVTVYTAATYMVHWKRLARQGMFYGVEDRLCIRVLTPRTFGI
ncbi:hypothetical protein D9611_010284 [Ephemerocybe angulata]|uniref:F-box domain-containing protein n=1 Tax=Ephemerocybe angulata TaxID=980116 RepID=A0A8H5BB94_9AGAR|nr:hypothetical protein D9611_010284 [Tulosesus angulatus]